MDKLYVASDKRYDKMVYNRVGNSGLKVSAISLGFWNNFGSKDNFDTMREMCRTAFDQGITQFDLANNYGPINGSAEENLGRILTSDFINYRDELVITTKAGYDMWPGPYGNFGSKKHLIASIDQSLKRLKLDYVDIFYHHRMDLDTPLEETMEAMASIVHSGKALYAGVSNYDISTTKKAAELLRKLHCPFIVNQRRYSLFSREIENDGVKDLCNELGIGIIAFSPLAQGLLTDKYIGGIPQDSRIASHNRFLKESDLTPSKLQTIKTLNDIALERGQSLAEMALSWVLRNKEICSVLIGASKPEQIIENVKVISQTTFTDKELEKIDAIVK